MNSRKKRIAIQAGKINHTPGMLERAVGNQDFYPDVHNVEGHFVATVSFTVCGHGLTRALSVERAKANAALFDLAPHAPHDCDIPGCPGAVNKRKLELFDEMREALRELYAEVKGECPSLLNEDSAEGSRQETEESLKCEV